MIPRRFHRGMSLTELLVGLAIGLVAAIVMLELSASAEAMKRNATGAADAQQIGALMTHILGREVANAGNGLAAAAGDLGTCPDTGNIGTTLRPIPVLITAGATAAAADSFVVTYAAASALAAPVPFAADVPAGSPLPVRSPLGFAAGDLVAAISRTGSCAFTNVTSVSPPDPEGVVSIAHTGLAETFARTSTLFNFGPGSRARRVRYDVVDGTLRSLDLVTPGAVPNPLASNVVTLKVQYGVDQDGDGFMDTWVPADRPPWNAASVLAAPAAALAGIKAVRIGLIMKSDVYDRDQTHRFDWSLFDCGLADQAPCAGRIEGSLPARWRYRSYEVSVPLRNAIWNARP